MKGRAQLVGDVSRQDGERKMRQIDQPQQTPGQAQAEPEQTVQPASQKARDQRLAQ
jgi:hypothetical protein